MKHRWRWIGAVVGAGVVAVLALLDLAGLLRPHPSARELVHRMSAAWEKLPGHHAELSAGLSSGGDGPTSSREWFRREGALIVGARDQMGFNHMERWEGPTWEYYQGGANLLVRVNVRNATSVPFARWRLSRIPSVADVVQVVRDAEDAQFVGNILTNAGIVWIIECQPKILGQKEEVRKSERDFDQVMFGPRWRVWLSAANGLPTHVLIGGTEPDQALRIGIQNIRPEPQLRPKAWQTLGGDRGIISQRVTLECDAQSEASMEKTRQAIRSRVDAWRKTLYGNQARSPSAMPRSSSSRPINGPPWSLTARRRGSSARNPGRRGSLRWTSAGWAHWSGLARDMRLRLGRRYRRRTSIVTAASTRHYQKGRTRRGEDDPP